MKHAESYQFDGAEDADQREEHIQRGDIVRCGREDCASAAENENERQQGEEKINSQAFALPQCLLKCWRLAVQLAHGSSGEPVRMSHPCVAFSRRTRLNTRFRELGVGQFPISAALDMAVRHIQSVMPATYPYSSLIIRPQIRGFTLCRIPEACTLYLQKE